MSSPSDRIRWLDLIRAIAAQMIVLHHLAFYGPIADRIGQDWPGVVAWWSEYARIAVQVFLVMSGFLVARSLARSSEFAGIDVWIALVRRYLRLFVPFAIAIACATLASIPARRWVGDTDWVSTTPDLWIVLAHLTGLFDYLAIEALTAGAWYVSIDFQIHLLVLLTLWGCHRLARERVKAERAWWLVVLALAILSFFVISRDPRWDITPFYFFGSFALGLAAERLSRSRTERPALERWVSLAILFSASVALTLEPAVRPAVALVSALSILALARGAGAWLERALHQSPGAMMLDRLIASLGRSAYSLFLIHFPLAILVNALYARFFSGDLSAALLAALVAWLGAILLSLGMYRWVERPIERWIRRT